jgi:hypothetical protein
LLAAAGTEQVAINGTILDYTVTLTNGKRAVPINSTLAVSATPASSSNITCTTGTTEDPLPLDVNTTAALAADAVVTCKFSVNVDGSHKAATEVPAITVTAAFGLAAESIIYTVPAAVAAAVPVFDGTPTIRKVAYVISGPSQTGVTKAQI